MLFWGQFEQLKDRNLFQSQKKEKKKKPRQRLILRENYEQNMYMTKLSILK